MKAFLGNLGRKSLSWWGVFLTLVGVIVAIAAWLWPQPFGGNTDANPSFEINLLNLPFKGETAYYVTDAIIRAGGRLDAYDDFELAPLAVEIVPHYGGQEQFGNIVLRLSGDAGQTRDILLWPDFDRSARTQTVSVSLADIVEVSGIKKLVDDLNSTLMLGDNPYQQASLQFEIIRLSEPDRPYDPALSLPVKNTPWRQSVAVLSRGDMVIDYALENFGGDATFHCRINITRTKGGVDASEHIVWSGTQGVQSPACASFTLKAGETHTATIPLNRETLGSDLARGRYIVQVYTFAERRDLAFRDGFTYENSSDLWVVSNPGDVRAFVVCNDPGKSCADSLTLPVEQAGIKVFPFSSAAEFANGSVSLVTRSYPLDERSANQYILDYSLDPQREGWVGFGVWFEELLDLSSFTGVRFQLTPDASSHALWFEVKYKQNDTYPAPRIMIGDGAYGRPTPGEQLVVIPFDAFEGVDWTAVDTLYFMIDSYMVPDANQHQIKISEIEFIR